MNKSTPITPEQPPKFPCWLWLEGNNDAGNIWHYWQHCMSRGQMIAETGEGCWATHWHPDQPEPPTERPTLGGDANEPISRQSEQGHDSPVISSNPTSRAEPPVPQWCVEAAKEINVALSGILTADTIGTLAAIIARHAPAAPGDTEMLDWLETGPVVPFDNTPYGVQPEFARMRVTRSAILAAMRGEKEGL